MPSPCSTTVPDLAGAPDVDAMACAGILLRCPRCGSNLDTTQCPQCGFQLELQNGIVCALSPERAAHYEQFLSDYPRIRAAEGRGSEDSAFYLALPYQDLSGRNAHQWKIRSRSYSYLVRHIFPSLPERASILDLGSGNCWMSYRLAQSGFRPVAVDLLTNQHDGLGAAVHFDRYLPAPIPRFQAEATQLPFRDHQFDAIVFNASFHYAEDYEATLREAFRCTKPRGVVVISDTPWYTSDESGQRMVAERQAAFRSSFNTASDSIKSLEYLSNARLQDLANALSIHWAIHRPWYGLRWALRPWNAKFRGRREPSRFRIYVTSRHA
jgi:ubiquinone/menaquinone biosynthesis C-methylase UbiE/predicted RNA-binding Zn-ribbon protein involved in translation (DUF1610 family)